MQVLCDMGLSFQPTAMGLCRGMLERFMWSPFHLDHSYAEDVYMVRVLLYFKLKTLWSSFAFFANVCGLREY